MAKIIDSSVGTSTDSDFTLPRTDYTLEKLPYEYTCKPYPSPPRQLLQEAVERHMRELEQAYLTGFYKPKDNTTMEVERKKKCYIVNVVTIAKETEQVTPLITNEIVYAYDTNDAKLRVATKMVSYTSDDEIVFLVTCPEQ